MKGIAQWRTFAPISIWRRSPIQSHIGRVIVPITLCAWGIWAAGVAVWSAPAGSEATSQQAFVRRYCLDCHNAKRSLGGLNLVQYDITRPERNAAVWESVLTKLHAGMMPPAGAPHPQSAASKSLISWLEARIDHSANRKPNLGNPALHRLNRTEYANSVRDLLNIDVNVNALLPADDMSHGFDNMADTLNISPALLAGYVRAAGKISRAAIGEIRATPTEEIYHLPSTLSQTQHIDGTPFGTRGGTVIRHYFPADGEYVFKMTLYFTTNTFLFGMYQKDEQLEIAINGERVAIFPVNPLMKVDEFLRTPPVKVKAGLQTITVAFLQKAAGPVEDFVEPFDHSLGDLFLGRTQGLTGLPHLRDVAIKGPYNITGIANTPSRQKSFACVPKSQKTNLLQRVRY